MRRKEVLYAVIGGVVGAVLVMAAGLFSPLGAQNEVADAEFGEITCRRIRVVGSSSDNTDLFPGMILLNSGDGGTSASISALDDLAMLDLGNVTMSSVSANGTITVNGVNGEVKMNVNEHGGYVLARSKDKGFAQISVDEHGGSVSVFGKGDKTSRAVMSVNEYGNGAVSTWDKNGYRLATLK